MTLPFAIILAAYLLGWLLAIRPAMRRRMLGEVCSYCQASSSDARHYNIFHPGESRYIPRGALRERNGNDVAWALFTAAWWPPHLAWAILVKLAWLLGAGVVHAVNRATPLTAPELERRVAEQAREIDRLTRQISSSR